MQLNAEASDEERQLLVPCVTRLACADTAEVEGRRQADLFPSEEVKTRLEAVQQGANTATWLQTMRCSHR